MMAASSPAVSDKSGTPMGASPASSGRSITAQHPHLLDLPKQNLRGLNKPKCIKCGNIARARCPFQSCKGCCVKAENPCHIHVLKQQSILPDKPQPPTLSSLSEQPSTVIPSTGAALRLSSLRQLSNTFANSLRTKKPLTRKDAVNINKWRFAKLRESIEGDIEIENEAFDRYMQNVSLLEETFFVADNAVDDLASNGITVVEKSSKDEFEKSVFATKMRLQSHFETKQKFETKIWGIVDQGLRKLQQPSMTEDDDNDKDDERSHADDLRSYRDPKKRKRIIEMRAERIAALNDLLEKLSKVRSEDDLKSCLENKRQLFNEDAEKAQHPSDVQVEGEIPENQLPLNSISAISPYSPPKLYSRVHINQDVPSNIETQFTSLDGIIRI